MLYNCELVYLPKNDRLITFRIIKFLKNIGRPVHIVVKGKSILHRPNLTTATLRLCAPLIQIKQLWPLILKHQDINAIVGPS